MTVFCHSPAQVRSLQHEVGGSLWQHPGGRAGALRKAAQRCGLRLCLPAASQLRVRTEPVCAPLSHTPGVSLQRKPAGGGAGGDGHTALPSGDQNTSRQQRRLPTSAEAGQHAGRSTSRQREAEAPCLS